MGARAAEASEERVPVSLWEECLDGKKKLFEYKKGENVICDATQAQFGTRLDFSVQ